MRREQHVGERHHLLRLNDASMLCCSVVPKVPLDVEERKAATTYLNDASPIPKFVAPKQRAAHILCCFSPEDWQVARTSQ